MKKTLITLMAVASCAMGASYSDFTQYAVAESVDTTGFDYSTNAVTVAVTLNIDVIKSYFAESVDTSYMLVKVTGNNSIGVGTLVKNDTNEYFSGAWNQTIDYTPTGIDTDMGRESLWTNANSATLVFSADRGTGARVVFTMNYTDGTVFQTSGTASGVKSSNWTPSGLTLDTQAITSVAMYNSYITADDAKAIGVGMLTEPSPVIPEPATATLSLLALAGLAARRRRK